MSELNILQSIVDDFSGQDITVRNSNNNYTFDPPFMQEIIFSLFSCATVKGKTFSAKV